MTVAEKIIKPTKPGIFRSVFLYTGQGETTLLAIPTGPDVSDYMYVLIDSDLDKEPKEVDLVKMFKDLFKKSGELSTFINTHPHNDHFGGIKQIYDEIGFGEVWHSNHKPGGEHKDKFKEFQYVLDKVGKSNQYHLLGTNEINKISKENGDAAIKNLGNIDFIILSPAKYLCDDIEDADADERNKRIHEQCGVIKLIYGKAPKSILITGDSDKEAWMEHITDYHKDKLQSDVLSASHHGSRTFFKDSEEDKEQYEDHIKNIKPTYLIVSAPKQKDSPHGHPHDDAMKIYKKYVTEENIYHLGAEPFSVIVDIDEEGNLSIKKDKELIEAYGNGEDQEDESKKLNAAIAVASSAIIKKPWSH